jgi:hypothetical protein
MKLADWLRNFFRPQADHASPEEQLSPDLQAETPTALQVPPLPPDVLIAMLRLAEKTEEVEFACDEVFSVLDQYADAVRRGEDVSALMPLVRHHMEICPGCCEELEALLAALNAGGE